MAHTEQTLLLAENALFHKPRANTIIVIIATQWNYRY